MSKPPKNVVLALNFENFEKKNLKFLEKIKNFQNLRLPVKINYFFRFSVVDCPGKTLGLKKRSKLVKKWQKKDKFDFCQK
jgi:hypothetical protein